MEFDSIEYWMADPRRLEATAGDEAEAAKHQAIASKYEALCSV